MKLKICIYFFILFIFYINLNSFTNLIKKKNKGLEQIVIIIFIFPLFKIIFLEHDNLIEILNYFLLNTLNSFNFLH